MKLKYLFVSIGIISVLLAGNFAFVAQGNQNGIKPAIFPVSPITPPPAVPTQFDLTGHIQSAAVDRRVCPASGNLDSRLWGGLGTGTAIF